MTGIGYPYIRKQNFRQRRTEHEKDILHYIGAALYPGLIRLRQGRFARPCGFGKHSLRHTCAFCSDPWQLAGTVSFFLHLRLLPVWRQAPELRLFRERNAPCIVGQAVSMLDDPEILILDEPTAGLDPSERIRFRNLISKFAQGRTILLVAHIVSDVECIAKEIIILKEGSLITQMDFWHDI